MNQQSKINMKTFIKNQKSLRPIADRVIIIPKEDPHAGLIITERQADFPLKKGTVVALGREVQQENCLEIGDVVSYLNGSGYEVEEEGVKCLVLRFPSDIIGVFTDEKASEEDLRQEPFVRFVQLALFE